ncbi:MAG: prephenate dehydratase domain-containing protein [Candidatus Woesearchaeota archaeon]
MVQKIAYLGPEKTYTEEALINNSPDSERIPLSDITSVFEAVESGQVDYGFVPHQNVIDWNIQETLRNLVTFSSTVQIVDAELLQINHVLAALKGHNQILEIYSKRTAIDQCSNFLHVNYRNAKRISANSTAGAMKKIADENLLNAAAIGKPEAAEQYGLEIIANQIANIEPNRTRFIKLAKKNGGTEPTGNDITSIAIHPLMDQEGFLYEWSAIVTKNNLNMNNLELVPDGRGGLMFYIDIQAHMKDKNLEDCLIQLESMPETEVFVFGSYRHLPLIEPKIKTIGIIGGTGIMGQGFFKPFYEGIGKRVLVAGRKTPLSYEEVIRLSDAIIINLDLDVTPAKIKELCPSIEPGKLVVDNTGVKSEIVPLLIQYTNPEVEILPIHTFFGAVGGKENLHGENIIAIHTERSGKLANEFENDLKKYRAKITAVTPEQHDLYASITQNLVHAIVVSLDATIRELVGHPDTIESFSTPPYRLLQTCSARVHSGDAKLYSSMMHHNPYATETFQTYLRLLSQIVEGRISDNREVFEVMMGENQTSLGQDYLSMHKVKSSQVDAILKNGLNPK